MGTTSIQKKILDVIRSEPTAIPGRAGETPISRLANQFDKLRGKAASATVDALSKIIEHPPYNMTRIDFWRSISFLGQYLPREERIALIEKYRPRLLGCAHVVGQSRNFVLMGFITSGGVLTESELMNDLAETRIQAPVLWLDAAVYSGLFGFIEKQLTLHFQERLISTPHSVKHLGMMLHSWREKWPRDRDFDKMINEFPKLIQDEDGRAVMVRWLTRFNW